MRQFYCFIILSLGLFPQLSVASEWEKNEILVGVFYFKNMYGHVHQNASKYSTPLTTIECGHPVKVYEIRGRQGDKKWSRVKVANYKGYVLGEFLSSKKMKCFQDRYPKFINKFPLDVSEMYYWGRLNDQYVRGKSQVMR